MAVRAVFDWDEGNRDKCRRHGVSIAEIEALFLGSSRIAPDPAHSSAEDRLIAVGRTNSGRALFVAFTYRERDGDQSVRATCTSRSWIDMSKKVPHLRTDEEAEAFLAQDLSDLDFSQFKPMHFEFEKKESQLNMRLPEPLLEAVKDRAKARGMPYTRYIRMLLERDIAAK